MHRRFKSLSSSLSNTGATQSWRRRTHDELPDFSRINGKNPHLLFRLVAVAGLNFQRFGQLRTFLTAHCMHRAGHVVAAGRQPKAPCAPQYELQNGRASALQARDRYIHELHRRHTDVLRCMPTKFGLASFLQLLTHVTTDGLQSCRDPLRQFARQSKFRCGGGNQLCIRLGTIPDVLVNQTCKWTATSFWTHGPP